MARSWQPLRRPAHALTFFCLVVLTVCAHEGHNDHSEGELAAVGIDAAGEVHHVHDEAEHEHDHDVAASGIVEHAHGDEHDHDSEHAVADQDDHDNHHDGHEHHHHDHDHHHDGHEHHGDHNRGDHDHHGHEGHEHHDHDDHEHHEHGGDMHAHHEDDHHDHESHGHDHEDAPAAAPAHHHHGHSHSHGHGHSHGDLHRVLREDEKHPWTAIALTFLSGGAAVLGGLLVVCAGSPSPAVMGHMLSFAAGIMLYISYGDMLTHAVMDMSGPDGDGFFPANAWLCAGMLIFWVIATLIPSGDGHGHSHGGPAVAVDLDAVRAMHAPELQVKLREAGLPHEGSRPVLIERYSAHLTAAAARTTPGADAGRSRRTLMTGMIAAVGITLHNMPEGLIVYNQTITGICAPLPAGAPPSPFSTMLASLPAPLSTLVEPVFAGVDVSTCLSRGVAVTFAIFLHNIPEGAAVASAMYADTHNAWQAMKWCIISALAEPVTAVVFGWAFSQYLTPYLVALLNAVVAGIMICLCIIELMPAACEHIDPKWAALSNIAGQVVMFLSLHFMRHTGMH